MRWLNANPSIDVHRSDENLASGVVRWERDNIGEFVNSNEFVK